VNSIGVLARFMPRDDSVAGRLLLGVRVAVTERTIDAVESLVPAEAPLAFGEGPGRDVRGDGCYDDPDPSQALAALGCPNSGLG